jgi:hypothetical protein
VVLASTLKTIIKAAAPTVFLVPLFLLRNAIFVDAVVLLAVAEEWSPTLVEAVLAVDPLFSARRESAVQLVPLTELLVVLVL